MPKFKSKFKRGDFAVYDDDEGYIGKFLIERIDIGDEDYYVRCIYSNNNIFQVGHQYRYATHIFDICELDKKKTRYDKLRKLYER